MSVLLVTIIAALIVGVILPIRWGIFGYLAATFILFLLQVGINTAMGFEGTSIEESLLLFNGSYAAYVGFNVQISYRAFVFPLLALTVPFIIRMQRKMS